MPLRVDMFEFSKSRERESGRSVSRHTTVVGEMNHLLSDRALLLFHIVHDDALRCCVLKNKKVIIESV